MPKAADRVVVNTGILYGKTVFTVCVSLYSTRVVLHVLGETDFGIYNLVAGVVAMLSFLNAAMSTSTQRYLSYYQGIDNDSAQKTIFANSLFLHIGLGILLILFLEIVGLFLFDGFLNIPEERLFAARVIFQFMIISVFFSVVSVPFVASLNAHENMLWVAIVDICEVLLKLLIAIGLSYSVLAIDNLIFYGAAIAGIGIVSFGIYAIFTISNYEECSFKMKGKIEKKILSELSKFAGWNLFGSLCGIGRTQGLAIIMNLFYGATINAAYAIANQVSSQMSFLSVTMLKALNPQIMKNEGMGNRVKMLDLSMMACKFGFFLLAVISIPCMFEMATILSLWLKEVPDNTLIFCNLILVSIMVNQLTIGLQSALQAIGRIKLYQLTVGTILLLNIPVSFILLKLGLPAYSTILGLILLELIACCFRLLILKKESGFSISLYFKKVLMKELLPTLSSIMICILITNVILSDITFRFLITGLFSTLVFSFVFYKTSLEKDEKEYIQMVFKRIKK